STGSVRPKLRPMKMHRPEAGFRATKNPAEAGFFMACLAGAEGPARDARPAPGQGSGGLDGLDARGQAALVAGSLVLVDQAAGAEAIQQRLGDGEGGFGAGGVVGVQGLEDLLDGGAELRALGGVARVAHDRLLGALLGGLDVGHGGGFLKNGYENGMVEYSEREIMDDSRAWVNRHDRPAVDGRGARSEEHTSELQSREK